jgi:hypothetical protein
MLDHSSAKYSFQRRLITIGRGGILVRMNVVRNLVLTALFCVACIAGSVTAQDTTLQIHFKPKTPEFETAAEEYRQIWESEGARIVKAMEKATGLRFQETKVEAIVMEAVSSSGFRDIPMILRASYPPDVKKGTLIHELGHRLQGHLFRKEDEDHPYLFLYLYDVWTELYGKEFADHQIEVESARKGLYDYEKAWKEAVALPPVERKAKWRKFLHSRTSS